MLSGVRPFSGNTLGEVCGQIMNEEALPPSHHNPAVPAELDRVVARCLAKDPKDRFASCEELAKSLYPFTRSRSKAPAPVAKNRTWWTAPTGHRDVWVAAAACLLLVAIVLTPRFIRSHYGIPAAPAHQYFRPGVPYEAFSYTRQTVLPTPFWNDSNEPAQQAEAKHPSPDSIHVEKMTLVDLNKPAVAQNFSSRLATLAASSARSNTP